MESKKKQKIVILGGGFGGLYTYKSLSKYFKCEDIDVTIVNRTNYFLFTPLLHEVATGSIAHHQVVESIRQLIYKSNAKLHIAEVLSVDPREQIVNTSLGELSYDVLVVALGATTNFFNVPGAQENALVLKDLSDAIKMRSLFIDTFEKASEIKDEDERKEKLTFAVVGGGPTGVELVSEIAELFSDTFKKYYRNTIPTKDVSLYLINSGPEILAPFDPKLKTKALEDLQKSGIKVLLNTGVKEVHKDGLMLSDGSFMKVACSIWTAGVKPNTPLFKDNQVQLDPGRRIVVNEFMQVSEYPNIFAIGDVASFAKEGERPLPMLAQVAVRQGSLLAYNVKQFIDGKDLKEFNFKSQGELVSLGQWKAIANINGYKFSGPFAWFLWRTIYLFKFISFSKKFKIAADWTMNIFYPRDITKS
jgi:NADH dehydrogenase